MCVGARDDSHFGGLFGDHGRTWKTTLRSMGSIEISARIGLNLYVWAWGMANENPGIGGV